MLLHVGLSLPSEAVTVPLARHAVAVTLSDAGLTADCMAEVALIVSEACTNAVYRSGEDAGYDLALALGEDYLTLEVTDSGSGFTERRTSAQMSPTSAESGRGLAMIATLADQVVFDTTAEGRGLVRLVKRLQWRDDAPLCASRN